MRLQRGTGTRLAFVLAGEIRLLLVTKAGGGFLDRGTVTQQFKGVVLALLRQPGLGVFAHVLEKMPVQCSNRNATFLRQSGSVNGG